MEVAKRCHSNHPLLTMGSKRELVSTEWRNCLQVHVGALFFAMCSGLPVGFFDEAEGRSDGSLQSSVKVSGTGSPTAAQPVDAVGSPDLVLPLILALFANPVVLSFLAAARSLMLVPKDDCGIFSSNGLVE